MTRQIRLLHVLLLLAAGGGAFVVAQELAQRQAGPEIAEVAERAVAAIPATGAIAATAAQAEVATTQPAPLRPVFGAKPAADPFQRASFNPPPVIAAPPPPPPAPPAPRAPPLPFSFVGLVERGTEQPTAFLARGEELIVVTAGETLDRNYRVESMTPTEIVFTYMPLKERQTLTVSGGPK